MPWNPVLLSADATVPFVLIPLLAAMAFWVWMLVDCANRETEGSTKLAWLLIVLFLGVIGAPLYFVLRKLPREKLLRYRPPPGLKQPWRNI